MAILGGHASAEPVNSSFRGKPYLITRLYSFKYSHLCGACESRVNFTLYFYGGGGLNKYDIHKIIYTCNHIFIYFSGPYNLGHQNK